MYTVDGLSKRLPVNELWLGRYFSERHNRHHFILDSKGGALNPWDKSTPRINSKCLRHDFGKQLIQSSYGLSDYYWVHVDDPAVPVGEILEIMNQFKKRGKFAILDALTGVQSAFMKLCVTLMIKSPKFTAHQP